MTRRKLDICGFVPKGFMTTDPSGVPYEMRKYLTEVNGGYRTRTIKNVKVSDGTLAFARNYSSPGERLTRNECYRQSKPYYPVDVRKIESELSARSIINPDQVVVREISLVRNWIIHNNIKILNVAGNSETTSPGIHEIVFVLMGYLFGLHMPFKGLLPVTKIISGAQTGADQAALRFALEYNRLINVKGDC